MPSSHTHFLGVPQFGLRPNASHWHRVHSVNMPDLKEYLELPRCMPWRPQGTMLQLSVGQGCTCREDTEDLAPLLS